MRTVIDWLEHRTGIESAIKNFLYEDIPASAGWHQIIGSLAVFFFVIQVFTGSLLAFNYAPTPGEAYNSVKYIMTELTGGPLIRGLHHWGASMMLIIVVLHMIQVFIYGAYKKPREATWMVGVTLLLITLAFGLTGYLLPWDNRAYWGTVVTTQIASQAPIAGPYLLRLLGSQGSVGNVTFSRFYALHTVLLPPLTIILIGIHIYLVRKHGVAAAPGDTAPKRKFFPEQVFKDTVGVAVGFIILFAMAVVAKVPLERLADPTDTAYIPRPEWYFLFLFQTLKFFKGPLETVGSVVLPGVAVLTLFLIPFIDRGPMIRLGKRTFAITFVLLAVIAWTGLTTAAVVTTPKNQESADDTETPATETPETATTPAPATSNSQTSNVATAPAPTLAAWQRLTAEELEGLGFFKKQACTGCHPVGGKNGIGPELTKMPKEHRNITWMVPHFKNPSQIVPGSVMPSIDLPTPDLNALSLFVLTLTPQNESALLAAPDFAIQGAMVYQSNHCNACHQIRGVGSKLAPALDGVGLRHDRAWLEKHFADPAAVTPGSIMPAYKLMPMDLDAICKYLLQLPKGA
ncbi:MAG TPA: cytochrome b N-terminal domain-containing protein [Bryobacteraceae bacterium]|jgi:quinol-cytochrome oxidoreductase complex cytochrome b subunit/mono/diheme cytochrome c family protein|nr:cytochrome b N-terminal domain-containing protein [Bryobacteraceae bacterium]